MKLRHPSFYFFVSLFLYFLSTANVVSSDAFESVAFDGKQRRKLIGVGFSFTSLLYKIGICKQQGDSWGRGHFHCPPDPICDHAKKPPKHCSSRNNSSSGKNENSAGGGSGGNDDNAYYYKGDDSYNNDNGNYYNDNGNDNNYYANANDDGGEGYSNYSDNYSYDDDNNDGYANEYDNQSSESSIQFSDHSNKSKSDQSASKSSSYWIYIFGACAIVGAIIGIAFKAKREEIADMYYYNNDYFQGDVIGFGGSKQTLGGGVLKRMGYFANGEVAAAGVTAEQSILPQKTTTSAATKASTLLGIPPMRKNSTKANKAAKEKLIIKKRNEEESIQIIELELGDTYKLRPKIVASGYGHEREKVITRTIGNSAIHKTVAVELECNPADLSTYSK